MCGSQVVWSAAMGDMGGGHVVWSADHTGWCSSAANIMARQPYVVAALVMPAAARNRIPVLNLPGPSGLTIIPPCQKRRPRPFWQGEDMSFASRFSIQV